MKSLVTILSLALCAALAAQQPQPAAPPQAAPQQQAGPDIPIDQANQQQARALVEKMIAALGGQAYLGYEEKQEEGRIYGFYQGEPRGTGAPYWRFWKWPDKDRTELLKDRDWVVLVNGAEGWETTFRGTRKQSDREMAEYLRRREYSMENVLREWLPQPGTALFYEGKGISDQRQVERVTIMNSNYQAVTLHIDSLTHLPVRKSYSLRDEESRQRIEEAEVWDNWRMVQGVNTPHSVTRFENGLMASQRFVRNVRYNSGLAQSLFIPPKVTMTDGSKR